MLTAMFFITKIIKTHFILEFYECYLMLIGDNLKNQHRLIVKVKIFHIH